MDEKNVRITADNLTYSTYQTTMDLLIENNSDQDLSVISGSIGFQEKTSDYQDYLTTDPVKIKTSALFPQDCGSFYNYIDQPKLTISYN